MSESSLSTRWWNQTRLQRATEKTYLSQLAAAQVQPNLKMRTAGRDVVVGQELGEPVAPLHRQNGRQGVELQRPPSFGVGDQRAGGDVVHDRHSLRTPSGVRRWHR